MHRAMKAAYLIAAILMVPLTGSGAVASGRTPLWDQGHKVVCSPDIRVVAKLWMDPIVRRPMAQTLAPGIVWLRRGQCVAAAGSDGLLVWDLGNMRNFRRPTDHRYHFGNLYQLRSPRPAATFAQGKRLAVALFLPGKDGGVPRLILNWYLRRHLRHLKTYTLRLVRCRNGGVEVAAPSDDSWFATLPYAAPPSATIQLWQSADGKPVGHLPPIWQKNNSLFCTAGGKEIYWVSGGHWVHRAEVGAAATTGATVRQVRLVSGALRWFALSPNGRYALLMASASLHQPSSCTAILVPSTGSGVEKMIPYVEGPAFATAAPAFAPNGSLAAFLEVNPTLFNGTTGADLFVVQIPKFNVVYRAKIGVINPECISISPNGRTIAVEGHDSIVILGIPRKVPRAAMAFGEGLPSTFARYVRLPPAH